MSELPSLPCSSQVSARDVLLTNSLQQNYSKLFEQRPKLQLPLSSISSLQHINPSFPVSEESDDEELCNVPDSN